MTIHSHHLGEVLYAVKHSEYFSISPDIHYAGHGFIAVGLCMYAVGIQNLLTTTHGKIFSWWFGLADN